MCSRFGLLVAVTVAMPLGSASATAFQFTSVPQAEGLYGVNPTGTAMVGETQFDGVNIQGLLWNAGSVTTFQGPSHGTSFTGINDGGKITAFCGVGTGTLSFLTSASNVEFTGWMPGIETAWGINNAGTIVGYSAGGVGLLRHADGTIEGLTVPGSVSTWPSGINNAGTIAGSSKDASGSYDGWIRDPAGTYTIIDVPFATMTQVFGVNDLGQVVGDYSDADGHHHGFVRDPLGGIQTVDFPGSTQTAVFGISNTGTIVGQYSNQPVGSFGFYAVPEPGSLSLLALCGLLAIRRRARA